MHILAIDDEPDVLLSLHEMLVSRGHTAVCVRTVERAKNMLELEDFDVLLADTNLPLTHGGALLEWIRTHYPDLPFLLLFSGLAGSINQRRRADILTLGADLLFSKIAFFKNVDKLIASSE